MAFASAFAWCVAVFSVSHFMMAAGQVSPVLVEIHNAAKEGCDLEISCTTYKGDDKARYRTDNLTNPDMRHTTDSTLHSGEKVEFNFSVPEYPGTGSLDCNFHLLAADGGKYAHFPVWLDKREPGPLCQFQYPTFTCGDYCIWKVHDNALYVFALGTGTYFKCHEWGLK